MQTHRITHPDDPLLPAFWTIYAHSFPEVEQRTLADHQAALREPDFHCRVLLEDGAVRGLLCFWDIVGLRYIEHFALAPGARSGGRGSRVLRELAADTPDLLLMLEIDPLVDAISRRRLGFYERLGYTRNEPIYIHPPYQQGHPDYPLILLSLGRTMTGGERAAFEDAVNREVMRYAFEQPGTGGAS